MNEFWKSKRYQILTGNELRELYDELNNLQSEKNAIENQLIKSSNVKEMKELMYDLLEIEEHMKYLKDEIGYIEK